MKRRLRMAGTAFGTILVPACMTAPPAGGPETPRTPPAQVGVSYRPMPGALAQAMKKPREQFAAGREEPTTTLTARPTAVPNNVGIAHVSGPVPEEAPMPRPVDPPPVPTADPTPPPDVAPTVPEPPPLPTPLLGPPKPVVEPGTDSEGVIRPPKPVIPGAAPVTEDPPPVEPPAPTIAAPPTGVPTPPAGPPLPAVEAMPRSKTDGVPATLILPSIGPPPIMPIPPATGPVIGSSVHEAKASPISAPPISAPPIEVPAPEPPSAPPPTPATSPTPPTPADSPLLMAVRAFQANRPNEAVEHLKAYDPATQKILLSLMPAIVRLTEGKLQQMKPEEMDLILDQRQGDADAPAGASLQASNVRLCREVHTFAHVEGYAPTHVFRPGDVVHLYMELANYTCVPDGRGGHRMLNCRAAWNSGTRPTRSSGGRTRRTSRTGCPPRRRTTTGRSGWPSRTSRRGRTSWW